MEAPGLLFSQTIRERVSHVPGCVSVPPPLLPALNGLSYHPVAGDDHNGVEEAFGSGENEKSRLLLHSEALKRSFCPQTQIGWVNLRQLFLAVVTVK